nr:MAG TPA: hypothetical protein [Caudoviricetes sp.]
MFFMIFAPFLILSCSNSLYREYITTLYQGGTT